MGYYDPTSTVNNEGEVVERYQFSAFGLRSIFAPDFGPQITSAYGWDFAFKGQFLDVDTGYYNYGYRYYSPELGRWLSRDLIGEEGGLNIYKFCDNNAPNTLDLLGLIGGETIAALLQTLETYCAGDTFSCTLCCFAIGQVRNAIAILEAAQGLAIGTVISAGSGGWLTVLGIGYAVKNVSDAVFGMIASYKTFGECKKEICGCNS